MSIKIPSNQITNNYTAGKEYLQVNTYQEYIGYFYELNNKYFIGKTFNLNAIELIKKNSNKINPLLINPQTSNYGKLSKTLLLNNTIISLPYGSSAELNSSDEKNPPPKFFCKKLNEQNIVIKRINEETYLSLSNNPLYQIIFIGTYNNITQSLIAANKQMIGLLDFIS
jgi:hypothetical protein